MRNVGVSFLTSNDGFGLVNPNGVSILTSNGGVSGLIFNDSVTD
jgi:hypothetical protein